MVTLEYGHSGQRSIEKEESFVGWMQQFQEAARPEGVLAFLVHCFLNL